MFSQAKRFLIFRVSYNNFQRTFPKCEQVKRRGKEILSPYQAFLQSALQGKVQNCQQKWSQEALSKRDIKMLGYLYQSSVSDLTV